MGKRVFRKIGSLFLILSMMMTAMPQIDTATAAAKEQPKKEQQTKEQQHALPILKTVPTNGATDVRPTDPIKIWLDPKAKTYKRYRQQFVDGAYDLTLNGQPLASVFDVNTNTLSVSDSPLSPDTEYTVELRLKADRNNDQNQSGNGTHSFRFKTKEAVQEATQLTASLESERVPVTKNGRLQVRVTDDYGQPVGAKVTVTSNSGHLTATDVTVDPSTNGEGVIELTDHVKETVTLTVVAEDTRTGKRTPARQLAVQFVAGAPDHMTVEARSTLTAGQTQEIKGQVFDLYNNAVEDDTVLRANATAGIVSPESQYTRSGSYRLRFTAPLHVQEVTLTAGAQGISESAVIRVEADQPANVRFDQARYQQVAGGTTEAKLVVTDQYGNRLAGVPLTLAVTGNATVFPAAVTTNEQGEAVVSVTDDRFESVVLTAETANRVKGTAEVVFRVPVTGVSIDQPPFTLSIAQQKALTHTVYPADATIQDAVWSSDDPKVATVNQRGEVTGVGEGTAIIGVKTEDGGFTAGVEVTVIDLSDLVRETQQVHREYPTYSETQELMQELALLPDRVPDQPLDDLPSFHEAYLVLIEQYQATLYSDYVMENRYASLEVSALQDQMYQLCLRYLIRNGKGMDSESRQALVKEMGRLIAAELKQAAGVKADLDHYLDTLVKDGRDVQPASLETQAALQQQWADLSRELERGQVENFTALHTLIRRAQETLSLYGIEYTAESPLDTDGEGVPDFIELYHRIDPFQADSDRDGLNDSFETKYRLDPRNGDSNDNLVRDGDDDPDGDGLTNISEQEQDSHPARVDSDGDGLTDSQEMQAGTDLNLWDTDGDTVSDRRETEVGSNPVESDSDGDGLTDDKEHARGDVVIAEEQLAKHKAAGVIPAVSIYGHPEAAAMASVQEVSDRTDVGRVPHLVGLPIEIKTSEPFERAALTFTLTEQAGDAYSQIEDLRVIWYDEKEQRLVPVPDQQADPVKKTITAETDHFSVYFVVDWTKWTELFDVLHADKLYDPGQPTVIRGPLAEFAVATAYKSGTGTVFNYGRANGSDVLQDGIIHDQTFAFAEGETDYVSYAIRRLAADPALQGKWKALIVASKERQFDDAGLKDALQTAKENQIKIFAYWTGDQQGAGAWSLETLATETHGRFLRNDLQTAEYSTVMLQEIWQEIKAQEDLDQDGIPDAIEQRGLLLSTLDIVQTSTSTEDADEDGVVDGYDTDKDGVPDGFEYGYTDLGGRAYPDALTVQVEVTTQHTLAAKSKTLQTNQTQVSALECRDYDPIASSAERVTRGSDGIYRSSLLLHWSWYQSHPETLPVRTLVDAYLRGVIDVTYFPKSFTYKGVMPDGSIKATTLYPDRYLMLKVNTLHSPNVSGRGGSWGPVVKDAFQDGFDPYAEDDDTQGVCFCDQFEKELGKHPMKGFNRKVARATVVKTVSYYNKKMRIKVIQGVLPAGYPTVPRYLYQVLNDADGRYIRGGYEPQHFFRVVDKANIYLNLSPYRKTPIINQGYAGRSLQGVLFDDLGFPIFAGADVPFTAILPREKYKYSDPAHFKLAKEQLRAAKKIPDDQLGSDPGRVPGYIWHHHQVEGRLQLVRAALHEAVRHTGGRALWGGGER